MTTRLPETLPTKERIAKGDLELIYDAHGNIRHASVKDTSVLAALILSGVLDELHGYYGKVFLDLKRAFLMPVACKANPLYAGEFFGGDGSDGVFPTLYLKVARRLDRAHLRLVEYSHEPMPRHPLRNAADMRHAYDALVKAVDQVRKIT